MKDGQEGKETENSASPWPNKEERKKIKAEEKSDELCSARQSIYTDWFAEFKLSSYSFSRPPFCLSCLSLLPLCVLGTISISYISLGTKGTILIRICFGA